MRAKDSRSDGANGGGGGEGMGGEGLDVRTWFALGTGKVGARLVGAARIAAALHERAAGGLEAGRGETRGVGAGEARASALFGVRAEGVSVEERLMLLDGVGLEDAR